MERIVGLIPEDALSGAIGLLAIAVIVLYRELFRNRERIARAEEWIRLHNGKKVN